MQAGLNFSSLQAAYTSTWTLGEEIKKEQANSVPQNTEGGQGNTEVSNVISTSNLLESALSDLQKNIINKALEKVAEVKDEMLKTLEEVFGVSSSSSKKLLSLEDFLQNVRDFGGSRFNIGGESSGISLSMGFFSRFELSIKGTIVGKDGVSRDLDLSISMSQSFVANLQASSANSNSSSSNVSSKAIDPLVIDYEGNGTELSDTTMSFDLDSDGQPDQISTLKKGSGFLALDKNGDGKINDGSELFGTQSGDGFKDLSVYDSNGDGKIDKDDPIYDQLRIWIPDENGEGELVGLGEMGIGVIYLNAEESQEMMKGDNGDLLGIKQKTADFLREDGSSGQIHHIDFIAQEAQKNQNNQGGLQANLESVNKAYLQNLTMELVFKTQSGFGFSSNSTQSQSNAFSFEMSGGLFSASSFTFSNSRALMIASSLEFYSHISASFNALDTASSGVSMEFSELWKQLNAAFESIQNTKEDSLLDQILKRFDENSYLAMNQFAFQSYRVQESSVFKNLDYSVLNQLLSA